MDFYVCIWKQVHRALPYSLSVLEKEHSSIIGFDPVKIIGKSISHVTGNRFKPSIGFCLRLKYFVHILLMNENQFSPLNIVTVTEYCFHKELSAHIYFIYFILCVFTDIIQLVLLMEIHDWSRMLVLNFSY